MKYHVSPEGPRRCRATIEECPYEEAGQPHFDTQTEAQQYYDETMQEKFGVAPSMSKTEAARQKVYAASDTLDRTVQETKERIADTKDAVVAYGHRIKDRVRNALASFTKPATQETQEAVEQVAIPEPDETPQTSKERVTAYTSPAKERVATAARIVGKSAAIFGRDIAQGVRSIDQRYQISSRVKSALSKVTRPVSDYTRSRVNMIREVVEQEKARSQEAAASTGAPEQTKKRVKASIADSVSEPRKASPEEILSFRLHKDDGSFEDIDLGSGAWLYDSAGNEQKAKVSVK